MLKALFRKQMLEVWKFLYLNGKTGKRRTGTSLVLYSLLMLLIFFILGAIFLGVAGMLCQPLVEAGMGWLYFAIMALMGIALGAFGSVFNTYAGLYQAKDNALLLSMPIPPASLLLARMSGVYVMGLLYESLVMIPTLIIYFLVAPQTILSVLFSILLIFVLSLFVLTLSCVLGWVVALISSKLKHKSFVTVFASLAFMAAYFYFYTTAYESLQQLLQNSAAVGETFQHTLYPLYQMGLAAQGNGVSMLLFTALVLVLFGLCYLMLSRSFLRIVTSSNNGSKTKYRKKALHVSGMGGALLKKELKRFTGSPTYMLNCGLGTLILPIVAVLILIKGDWLTDLLGQLDPSTEPLLPLLGCAAVCMMTTLNDITAPSVSLEGKNLWIVQTFPVPAWKALQAKLYLHLLLTAIPAILCTLCLEIVLKPAPLAAILMLLCVLAFTVFSAAAGLFVNLNMPNLDWTNETVPVKQSMGVMLALFGGWAIVILLGGLYYLTRNWISADGFLICSTVLLALCAWALLVWLKHSGAKRFELL